MALVVSRPAPSLQQATDNSTHVWQRDLQSLFNNAKDRFPDVLWDVLPDDNPDPPPNPEQVWGHKAIVYARAPPSFQARYFSFRPAPIASPGPYFPSTYPAQSALSLTLDVELQSRSPSPAFRPASPSPSTTQNGVMHLTTSINPTLFSKELEYLYTGKGFGEAFEFLFDSKEHRHREEGDAEESRIDKLRKDLVFMWRSRLYSDVRVVIEGSASSHHENTAAVFSTHRFILVSRCSYFHTALLAWPGAAKDDNAEPETLTLPSPPFTPPALHFILGFIYTGTLIFSNRSYDLDTGFHILRSAMYLGIDTLHDEIQARLVQEMLHGLYHAFLEFAEYERVTGGKWGVGGCRCRQCARRIPRVIEFALLDDVRNPHLERGARRALVGLYGEGWATPEFSRLDKKVRDTALKGVAKRTTPLNIFPLLFATDAALKKLETMVEPWVDIVTDMIRDARKVIDQVLCSQADECFEQAEWLELMEANGARFEDGEKVECIMESVRRGFSDKSAGTLYQNLFKTLVSSILLRAHPTDVNATMLTSTSHIYVQVEETRVELLRWMRKTLGREIEVPVDDLTTPPSPSAKGSPSRSGLRSTGKSDGDGDTISMHSLRTSVLNRNMAKHHVTPTRREPTHSSGASVRSVTRSVHSTTSRASTVSSVGPSPRRSTPSLGLRPDSKLTPSASSSQSSSPVALTTPTSESSDHSPTSSTAGSSTTAGQRSAARLTRNGPDSSSRPKSLAPSVSSAKSRASTIRKTNSTTTPTPSLRVTPVISRPSSSVSNNSTSEGSSAFKSAKSEQSTAFKTAKSELSSDYALRPRKVSSSSTVSAVSTKTTPSSPKVATRPRRTSAASVSSTTSTVARAKRAGAGNDSTKLSPSANRTASNASIRSTASASPSTLKKVTVRKSVAGSLKNGEPEKTKVPPLPATTKGKGKAYAEGKPKDTTGPQAKGDNTNTKTKESMKRKSSAETITKSSGVVAPPLPSLPADILLPEPRGAMLEVGIPCIISSKRARFRALARYIGEVEGETGPWVGVEVPMGDAWPGDKLDARQWNDGTWGGIRYFDLAGIGSDWDYGEEKASRRRRTDWIANLGRDKGLKREGEQLSIDRAKRFRSVSPAVSDVTTAESRAIAIGARSVDRQSLRAEPAASKTGDGAVSGRTKHLHIAATRHQPDPSLRTYPAIGDIAETFCIGADKRPGDAAGASAEQRKPKHRGDIEDGDPAPKDRSSLEAANLSHSSGRGGAGNIRFSDSVPRPITDGPDDFSVTRGREPRPPSEQNVPVYIGRGGAGNIRSPSRNGAPNPAESAAIKEHEKGLIRHADEARAANFQSSGRGGVGNMTRSNSHSHSRSRSRGPNATVNTLSATRSIDSHSKASLEEGRVLYDVHENP
ncbi:hypothetical protein EVG20_g7459 [Dentipellis fragilis]|uniref:BTB domain-containing protein n=1 Tax=Dentipellis fragilis TaxID=205917 RepID=A0A4Y9YFU7_9AGAM|nr:hypothetical protein EVG20_g7459 [Dentipellis fragilis]